MVSFGRSTWAVTNEAVTRRWSGGDARSRVGDSRRAHTLERVIHAVLRSRRPSGPPSAYRVADSDPGGVREHGSGAHHDCDSTPLRSPDDTKVLTVPSSNRMRSRKRPP